MMLSLVKGVRSEPDKAGPWPTPGIGALALLGSIAVHAALLFAPRAPHRAPDPPAPTSTIVHVRLAMYADSDSAVPETAAPRKATASIAPRPAINRHRIRDLRVENEVQAAIPDGAFAAHAIAENDAVREARSAQATSMVVNVLSTPREVPPASTPVMFLHAPEPDYPASAREEGQEGLVILRVRISKEGRPLEIKIRASSGVRVLDAAAVAGVKRWTFSPAREGKYEIEAWMEVPIRFRLNGL